MAKIKKVRVTTRGPKATRTETISVRLDPRLRYLVEIASRTQRRSLSSYVEWVVAESIKDVFPSESSEGSLEFHAEILWDINEPIRLVNLALKFPGLLNHDEQQIWAVLKRSGGFWEGTTHEVPWRHIVSRNNLKEEVLLRHWDDLCRVARGEADVEILPTPEPVEPPDGMPF
jgi:hypothetical protein